MKESFDLLVLFVVGGQLVRGVLLHQKQPSSQLLDKLLLLLQFPKLGLDHNMQYILILKHQIGSLLNDHLEDTEEFSLDCDDNRVASANFDIDLWIRDCSTEAI